MLHLGGYVLHDWQLRDIVKVASQFWSHTHAVSDTGNALSFMLLCLFVWGRDPTLSMRHVLDN